MNTSTVRLIGPLLCLLLALHGCGKDASSPGDVPQVRLLESPAQAESQAPNLARGADGTLVMSWIGAAGDGVALRYAEFDQQGWGETRTVVTGDNWFVNWADFPSVVPVHDDLWAAHWLQRREAGGYAYDIRAALSSDAGASWSESFTPHTDNTDTEHGFVTLFPDRNGVGAIWLDGRKMVNEYDENDVGASGMTLRAATFDAAGQAANETLVDDLICDCCQTDVTVTPGGPVAVYRNRTVGEIRDIYISRLVDGKWQPGVPVGDDNWEIPGCPVNGPVIQSHQNTVAVAWFSAVDDVPNVQVAWSDDAGKTLSEPIPVASGALYGHVGAAMLPGGDMAITWIANGDNGSGELHVQRFAANGASGADTVIAEAGDVAPFSVPQVAIAGDVLLLAWSGTAADTKQVRTALVPLSLLD